MRSSWQVLEHVQRRGFGVAERFREACDICVEACFGGSHHPVGKRIVSSVHIASEEVLLSLHRSIGRARRDQMPHDFEQRGKVIFRLVSRLIPLESERHQFIPQRNK